MEVPSDCEHIWTWPMILSVIAPPTRLLSSWTPESFSTSFTPSTGGAPSLETPSDNRSKINVTSTSQRTSFSPLYSSGNPKEHAARHINSPTSLFLHCTQVNHNLRLRQKNVQSSRSHHKLSSRRFNVCSVIDLLKP